MKTLYVATVLVPLLSNKLILSICFPKTHYLKVSISKTRLCGENMPCTDKCTETDRYFQWILVLANVMVFIKLDYYLTAFIIPTRTAGITLLN